MNLSGSAPILVIAYNRFDLFKQNFDALKIAREREFVFSIDGPKNPNDIIQRNQILNLIKSSDWLSNYQIIDRTGNLGLRFHIPSALNEIFVIHDRVIVIEEDCVLNENFFNFMDYCLEFFAETRYVWHISGYNAVPSKLLINTVIPFRLSNFPKSYAWGTWKDRWVHYNDTIDLASMFHPLKRSHLVKISGGIIGYLSWLIEFKNAKDGIIDTWAYRWLFSIWMSNGLSISPNVNLVNYIGEEKGTNVRFKSRWKQLPVIFKRDYLSALNDSPTLILNIDRRAEMWEARQIYRNNPKDLLVLILASVFLRLKYVLTLFKKFL